MPSDPSPPSRSGRFDKPAPRSAAPSRTDLLARSLAAEIMDGSRAIGSTLPGEAALAAAHGATAPVARAAVRQLAALGLVGMVRGGAPRVIASDIRARYVTPGGPDGAGGYLVRTRLVTERQRQVPVDAELASLLDAAEGGSWLRLGGLLVAADAVFGPLACFDAWLATRNASVAPPDELTPATVGALLGVEVAAVEEEITAGVLTPAQARHLRARGGAPCLLLLRRYRRRGGVTIAALRDIHPAERIAVSIGARG